MTTHDLAQHRLRVADHRLDARLRGVCWGARGRHRRVRRRRRQGCRRHRRHHRLQERVLRLCRGGKGVRSAYRGKFLAGERVILLVVGVRLVAVGGGGTGCGGCGRGRKEGRLGVGCCDCGGRDKVLCEGVSGATADSVALLCINWQVAEQGLPLYPGEAVGGEVGDGDGQVDAEGGEQLQVGRGSWRVVNLVAENQSPWFLSQDFLPTVSKEFPKVFYLNEISCGWRVSRLGNGAQIQGQLVTTLRWRSLGWGQFYVNDDDGGSDWANLSLARNRQCYLEIVRNGPVNHISLIRAEFFHRHASFW